MCAVRDDMCAVPDDMAFAKVAQLVEQSLRKGEVVGSTPTFGSE